MKRVSFLFFSFALLFSLPPSYAENHSPGEISTIAHLKDELCCKYSKESDCTKESDYIPCSKCDEVIECIDTTESALVQAIEAKNETDPSLSIPPSTKETPSKIQKKGHFTLLPHRDLFPPLVASPREPQFSARYEKNNTELDGNYAASVNSFGDYLPIFEYTLDEERALQFSVDGALYAIFNLDTPSLDLFNMDFITGFSLSYQHNESLTFRARLFHVSSHLGDEFLIANPEVVRKNSSYEDFQVVGAYTIGGWRFYGGGGHIVRSDPEIEAEPWSTKGGIEFRRPIGYFNMDALAAVEIQSVERMNWRLNRSVMAGIVVLQSETREVRFMGNYYSGGSQHGQFFRESLEYFGLGVYFIV
jgi:hypothetical protein